MKNTMLAPLLLALASPVSADTLVVQLHGLSYHADRTVKYNETNTGVALRYYRPGMFADYVTLGHYKNSNYDNSDYLGLGWDYKLNSWLSLGVVAGGITGYKRADVLPMVAPYITLWDRLHVVSTTYPQPVTEISLDVFKFDF